MVTGTTLSVCVPFGRDGLGEAMLRQQKRRPRRRLQGSRIQQDAPAGACRRDPHLAIDALHLSGLVFVGLCELLGEDGAPITLSTPERMLEPMLLATAPA
jgi:hypothetical protein